MTDAALAFVGGLAGSAHCAGMCGAFVLAVGAGAPSWRANVARQTVYALGRIFTYAAAGGLAGYFGLSIERSMPAAARVQAWLAVMAGALLVVQGLRAAGILPSGWKGNAAGPCLTAAAMRAFLGQRSMGGLFLAGVFNGFVPCGLVYAYLALAMTTQDLGGGLALMAAFGLGTAPAMVAIGATGALLGLAARRRLTAFAAWCVILTGAIAIGRGLAYMRGPVEGQPVCPGCEAAASLS